MTIFCELVLEDGTKVGMRPVRAGMLLQEIEFKGKVYRVLSGRALDPESGQHVADRLLLTVEETS